MEGSLFLNLLFWWYGERFAEFWAYLKKLSVFLFDFFSVEICLKTLFHVWKRDQIFFEDLSLSEKLEAISLNFASRFVGFLIKTLTILAYIITSLAFFVAGIALIIIWLVWPFAFLIFIYFLFTYK